MNIINVIYRYFQFKLGTNGYYLWQLDNWYINHDNYRAHWCMNIGISVYEKIILSIIEVNSP